jgi:hypothetical protein
MGDIVLLDAKENINNIFINRLKRQNYTPFGTQFKNIISSTIFNYGTNFGVEVPLNGNILYRGFFEIELPVLYFTDSLIKNEKYTVYKNNLLSNIQNQIDYWKNLYNNMNSFSNIMIEVYIEATSILKLQNITLNFLQSRILYITNKYGENLYIYRLSIDSTILTNVDIAAYIMGLTTLNITTVNKTINNMYNNNINYLNYYYGNINYYTKEYAYKKEGKIFCKWIDHLGHYYFNYFELVVNGVTVDNYSNDFLHIYQKQSVLSEYLENYNELIGNTDRIYRNKGSPNIIYTPLIFSFNNINEPSQSIPLVGMMNSNIRINSRVNDLKNLVYLQDWREMFIELKKVPIRRDQHTIDEKNCMTIYDLPYDSIELLLPEYIYIYNCSVVNKRVLDAKYPGIDSNTILINYGTLQSDGTYILTEEDYIYFMNIIRTETKINESSKIAIAGYHYFIDYNYVLNLIPKPKVSLLIEYGYIDNYEKKFMAQNKLNYLIETHHEVIIDINKTSVDESLNDVDGLVKDLYVFGREKLDLNGISKYGKSQYTKFTTDYIKSIIFELSTNYNLYDFYNVGLDSYKNIANYFYLNSPLPEGIWYRTFSLNPYSIQPSGFINMNHIEGKNIKIELANDYNNYYKSKNNKYNLGIEFKVMYTKYNIMNVKDGNIELAFYN